jgi:hypothetical protein
MCCNPANERVDFEDGWLMKSSFIPKDSSLPGPNFNIFLVGVLVAVFWGR